MNSNKIFRSCENISRSISKLDFSSMKIGKIMEKNLKNSKRVLKNIQKNRCDLGYSHKVFSWMNNEKTKEKYQSSIAC
jgi:hypothetical protein